MREIYILATIINIITESCGLYSTIFSHIVKQFPYGLAVKIRCFHRCGLGSIPGVGTFILGTLINIYTESCGLYSIIFLTILSISHTVYWLGFGDVNDVCWVRFLVREAFILGTIINI